MSKQSSVSRALKMVREFHDLSQTEAADRLGISKSYLSELEAGKKTPTVELLHTYSERFDIPASTLLLMAERMEGKASATQQRRAEKVLKFLEWVAEEE